MHDEFTEEDLDELTVFGPGAADDGHRLQIYDGPDDGWLVTTTWKPPVLRAIEEMDPEYLRDMRALLGVAMTRLLRRPEVEARVGLARSRIYELVDQGRFPAPVKLAGGRAVGWVESEIEEWLQAQIDERDGE